ncbi:MAG: hypothetical protein ABFC84_00555 [Veillonellales bacterium]
MNMTMLTKEMKKVGKYSDDDIRNCKKITTIDESRLNSASIAIIGAILIYQVLFSHALHRGGKLKKQGQMA